MRRGADPLALPTVRGEALELRPKQPRLGVDERVDREWIRGVRRPWAIDVFSGAGGMSLGLEQAGFRVIAAADSDQRAVETHRANLPGIAWQLDLTDPQLFIDRLRRRGVHKVDLVAGGPPCQPFSRAGAAKLRSLVEEGVRSADDDRVQLWTSFLAVVDAFDPRAVLMENVPDMARWADGDIVLTLMSALRERGYQPDARVLNAWEHGVPQHRARLFLVAIRSGHITWPRRRPLVTLGDAIGDLPDIPPAQRKRELAYPAEPVTTFQRAARVGLPKAATNLIWDHCSRDVRKDDAEAFGLMPQGGTYADLPKRLRRYRSDIFDDKYKRLSWAEVSRTITAHIAKDGYWYIHPDQGRTLSIREAARVQTFPDRFRFAGHSTVQLRQIGNAVPPALARAVGRRLAAALSDGPAEPDPCIADRLLAWKYPHQSVEPWLRRPEPWLVLAGELALQRLPPPSAAIGFATIQELGPSPAEAVRNQDSLRERLEDAGLGSRAQVLIEVAQRVVDDFDGIVPQEEPALLGLPMVGSHVASAVRCYGHRQRVVFVNASTMRFVDRVCGRDPSSSWTTRLEIYRVASRNGPDRTFNLAVRALTATYCMPSAPRCPGCPLVAVCHAGKVSERQTGRA